MNDDAFEKKLHALTGPLRRPDPTPAWKADILARARREADANPRRRHLPPRWLMVTWAAAWVVILVMNFSMPGEPISRGDHGLAAEPPTPAPAAVLPRRFLGPVGLSSSYEPERRSRSMNLLQRCWQNRWMRRLVWTGVTLVTLYALLCTWVNWSGAREWRTAQAMVKADGETLDFRATMNEPIPDADNYCAIPLLKDLALVVDNDRDKGEPAEKRHRLEKLKLPANLPSHDKKSERPKITNAVFGQPADLQAWADWLRKEGSLPIPPDSGNAARDVLAALSKHDPILQELADGLHRPEAQWTPAWKTRILPALLPSINLSHYATVQALNPTLGLRAIAAARTGDAVKAHESVLIMARLNQACMDDPFLIGLLIGASGAGMLHGTTWELCHTHTGTAEDFARLESALTDFDFHRASLHAWRSEVAGMVDTLQYMKGQGDRGLSLFRMVDTSGRPSGFDLRDYTVRVAPVGLLDSSAAVLADREMRYLIRPLRQEGWEPARQAADDWEKELIQMKANIWKHPTYFMTSLTAPLSKGVIYRAAYAQALVNQAVIACALERYRLATGSYPDSLDPVKLAGGQPLPPDPMNGKPMHYRKSADGRYALWSVGFDGKDDGGKRVLDKTKPEDTRFYQPSYVGDWVWDFPAE